MENEVWYILKSVANAMNELHSLEMNHGDIQPVNIIFAEGNIVKLMDALCYDVKCKNGLLRMMDNSSYSSPLAPELVSQLNHRLPTENYDKQKADIYSLGITILSLCSLKNFKTTFYESAGGYRIKQDCIDSELDLLGNSKNYSKDLGFLLKKMLQPDPNLRINFKDMESTIRLLSSK